MTRAELLSLARLYVPEASSSVISDDNVYILLNQAALEFVTIAEALPTSTLFNVVAEQQEYAISTQVTTFAKVRSEGLWWYNSTNSKWVRLKPKTIRILDKKFPQWRDASSGSPEHYSIDGDIITTYPKPETAVTSGFKLYHFAISANMTVAGHYPFTGSTTRYPFLAKYEENLLDYYRYRAKWIMGKGIESEEAKQMFVQKAQQAKAELKSRRDLAQEAHAGPQTQHAHYRGAFSG